MLFDYKKYIIRIFLFFLIIILLAYSFSTNLYKGFFYNEELNSAIVLIFLIGTFIVLKNIVILGREENLLNNFLDKKKINSNYKSSLLIDLLKLLNSYNISNLPTYRVKEVLERIIVKFDNEREIIKYISALLVFLGLLGTFWGLLITIDAVGLTISNLSIDEKNILTNFSNLKDGLNAPLAGMGTAFSSSLFGLAGSLCLGFIEIQGSKAQNDFIALIENKFLKIDVLEKINTNEPSKEYTEALLYQVVNSLTNLEEALTKSEESRKNFESLIIELGKTISKINNELNIRSAQYNNNEINNSENLRGIEEHLKGLKEHIYRNKEDNTKELAKEIQVLAKTVSLIKK